MTTSLFLPLAPLPTGAAYYRESHPFGPDGAGGFKSGLGVEIDPAQLDPYGRVLAVAPGLLRVVPDPTPLLTVSAVLKPSLLAAADLAATLGPTTVLFIYRGLDPAAVKAAARPMIEALPDDPIFSPDPADARADRFAAGDFAVDVAGGAAIGAVLTPAAGWAGLELEVALVPGGLGMTGEGLLAAGSGWDRVKELIDLAAPTRRYDPRAFYELAAAGGNLELDPSHTGHALLEVTTRRVLIEVRDEYDAPFTTDVTIYTAGVPTTGPAPAGGRGTFVVDSIAGAGPPNQVAYEVTVDGSVLTDLPSGTDAAVQPSRTLQPPAHWALQSIFMQQSPSATDEPRSWLVENVALPRFTEGNLVTPIRDGVELLGQYATAMAAANLPGHFIYIIGWEMVDSFNLVDRDPTTSVRSLTLTADARGADVRALLWDQPGTTNTAEVNHINTLPGGHGAAILDNWTLDPAGPPSYGSHHQKCLIVNSGAGAIAWAGGIDINTDRRDTPAHGAIGAFHDVHSRVEGPAVGDLHQTFVERWNNHPAHRPPLPTTPPPFDPSPGSQYVQIARTYPPRMAYPFAPTGSLVPLNAILRAIARAKRFIYIEDQYLTPYPGTAPATAGGDTVGVLSALQTALATIDYLIIVIPNHTDQPQNRFRRQQFIAGLQAAARDKVHVFFLAREGPHPGPGEVATEGGCGICSGGPSHRNEIYVHTKLWIVDDVCAKIGSCNLNRRGYTHDSELDVVVVDGALQNGARAFARNLRLELWGEHLGMTGARSALLEDHKAALDFWRSPPPGARVRPYLESTEVELLHTDIAWNTAEDPDGR